MPFAPATKRNVRLRCALEGPPGSGKTWTSLAIARALVGPDGRIAFIDTERGSASKYADDFSFDVVELESFAPSKCVELVEEADKAGYDLLIIDSLSHFWMGTDGMLEQVDRIAKRSKSPNSFAAWKDAAPQERALWDTILGCNMHVIATLRTKTEYVIEERERNGKTYSVPRKVGLAPVQRDGLEYEFDVVAEMDMDHVMTISKTRCSALTDRVFRHPGKDVADILRGWLGSGGEPAQRAKDNDLRTNMLADMKAVIASLKLPSAVGAHIIQHEGYEKSTDMPDDVLAHFVDRLREVNEFLQLGAITHADLLGQLQTFPSSGKSPLDVVLDSLRKKEPFPELVDQTVNKILDLAATLGMDEAELAQCVEATSGRPGATLSDLDELEKQTLLTQLESWKKKPATTEP